MPKCEKCGFEFNNWMEINGAKKNLSSRKYCLDCSPFGSHNTKKFHEQQIIKPNLELTTKPKLCVTCKTIKPPNEFYKKSNKNSLTSSCKKCICSDSIARQKTFKKKCVEYKGGKCETCGYNSSLEALEFHHINREDKNFLISRRRSHSLSENVKKELDKCKLVCVNCHREEHFKNRHQQS